MWRKLGKWLLRLIVKELVEEMQAGRLEQK